MEGFKGMTVWELLSFLRSKVRQNVDLISENNKKVFENKKIGQTKPEHITRLSSVIKRNSELANENSNLTSLVHALQKLGDDYRQDFNEIQDIKRKHPKVPDEDGFKENVAEYLDKTINGELSLDEKHPFLGQKWFLERLYQECLSLELYEMCDLINKIKGK